MNQLSSNPHPARRLDATWDVFYDIPQMLVPILIQPEDWMQQSNKLTYYYSKMVPILIQPEDWMQQEGATEVNSVNQVPILIQPEDWMQP